MITFSDVRNPVYVTKDEQAIRVEVKFDHLDAFVEFIARDSDVEQHGQRLFHLTQAGEFGAVAPFVEPVVPNTFSAEEFKTQVEAKLVEQSISLGFKSVEDALTYCEESSVPSYQQKALALRKWRSLLRAWAEEVLVSEAEIAKTIFANAPAFVL